MGADRPDAAVWSETPAPRSPALTSTVRTGPATIYAVAERAGVSTATVSRVFRGTANVSERSRRAVMAAAEELHYVPAAAARALAGRRSDTLGIVLPEIDGPYYADLVVGFEMAASSLGFAVMFTLADARTDPRGAVAELLSRTDGLAFAARSAVDDDLIADLAARHSIVTIARADVDGADAFFAENPSTAETLTSELIAAGRRRLAFVGSPVPGSDIAHRRLGFDSALAEAGLAPTALLEADPIEAQGLAVAERLLDDGTEVDAIVCGNDELALAIMSTLLDAGVRIPEDIAVTGWDDTHAARYIRPGLTSVAQPTGRLGAMAAQRLVQRLSGALAATSPVVLPSTIKRRGSTGVESTTR